MARKKLYLIGVDSAPLWLIKELSKKHSMDGFLEFEEKGVLQELESTLPPVTAAAWPSIYTGLSPAEHGVMDFLYLDKNYSKQLIYYDSQKHPPFWDTLSKKGIRSLVVTPAMSLQKSESDKVDMITGWPLQPRYSSKKLEEIAKRFNFKGEPEIGLELEKGELSVQGASKKYLKSIKARSQMSKYLIENGNYDISFVCFTETDRIQHYALNLDGWETSVAPLYKAVSDFAKWVIDRSRKNKEDALILLVSDHGAQPIKNKFLINSWLVQNKFATIKQDGIRVAAAQGSIGTTIRRHIRDRVMRLKVRRMLYNAMPGPMRKIAERIVDEMPDQEYTNGKFRKIYETDFEMSNTKAFAAISFGTIGMIWLNDKRFSSGISFDKKKVKGQITKGLLGLSSEEGDRLILNVHDGNRYYKNSSGFIVPDIMFEMKPNYINDFSYVSDFDLFMEPEINRKGDHSRFGVIGMIGEGNASKIKIPKKMGVEQICPIILSYFNDKWR